jgi:hypothetical protein
LDLAGNVAQQKSHTPNGGKSRQTGSDNRRRRTSMPLFAT